MKAIARINCEFPNSPRPCNIFCRVKIVRAGRASCFGNANCQKGPAFSTAMVAAHAGRLPSVAVIAGVPGGTLAGRS